MTPPADAVTRAMSRVRGSTSREFVSDFLRALHSEGFQVSRIPTAADLSSSQCAGHVWDGNE